MASPHDGHRKRMKEDFLKNGFTDDTPTHKILEMLLFYTIPRKDTNELAHKLIEEFGSLAGVMDAPVSSLLAIPGITENTACLLKLIMPTARVYLEERSDFDQPILSIESGANYLKNKFIGRTVETVFLLCLDGKGRIIRCAKLSEGDEISVGISARTVVEEVIKTHATSVMLAHNHPCGFALPSMPDVRLTADIARALKNIGVNFIDHIIVSDGDYISLVSSSEYEYIFRLP